MQLGAGPSLRVPVEGPLHCRLGWAARPLLRRLAGQQQMRLPPLGPHSSQAAAICANLGVSESLSHDECSTGGPYPGGRASRAVPDGPSECCWASVFTVRMAQLKLVSKTQQPELRPACSFTKGHYCDHPEASHKRSVPQLSSPVSPTWKIAHHTACEDSDHTTAAPQGWWIPQRTRNHSPRGW